LTRRPPRALMGLWLTPKRRMKTDERSRSERN
jgi:hypothetical protein